jgi:hypothetical protein
MAEEIMLLAGAPVSYWNFLSFPMLVLMKAFVSLDNFIMSATIILLLRMPLLDVFGGNAS